ncbi:SDR family oxidoreductase [Streptomyces sp. NPDC101455]|uniref:SDR family oxidoreductase n=1 Tax=Streptomyces sp. NPDC101455 TaxID=3366142 RepID=UPI00381EEAAB
MVHNVVVVIGVGGMGQAIARRLGAGARLLLADFDEQNLTAVAEELRDEGYQVSTRHVDISSRGPVAALASEAAALGPVHQVAHTAGLSPVQAPVPAILAVDLVGVALVADEFGRVIAPGGAGVFISSMAGHSYPGELTPQEALQLATVPAEDLLALPVAAVDNFPEGAGAYGFAKRANQLRIQAASTAWGAKGARINSVSPGIISTPMGQAELGSDNGAIMRAMTDGSNAKRLGTPSDIAAAVEFLLSPAAGFISGTDLLVDGGVTAAIHTGHITFG